MKIAFLGDAHWGARGNSEFFLQKQVDFYREVFFPYLVENDIKHVIQFGDLLDQRKFVNIRIMYNLQREYLRRFEELGITQDIIIGNHDVVHNNTNKISALVEIASKKDYPNTTVHYDPCTKEFDGVKLDFIPWMNRENEQEVKDFIQKSSSEYLIGHLEINSFEMVTGIQCRDGFSPDAFTHYKTTFSGHFHKQSKKVIKGSLIHYIGTPYEMNWGDYGDQKGFHIFDTSTGETEFIKNPTPIYYKVMYDDTSVDYDSFDESRFSNSIVKIIVEEKENDLMFDRFMSRVQIVAQDFQISDLDSFDVSGEEIENMDIEDSLSILFKAVDGLPESTRINKNSIKKKINSIHKEAEDLMVSE